MPGLTEAGIAAIGSAAAAGISAAGAGISASVANRKSYKYTKKLIDYQNEMNIANWNLQNEYNSPAAQMARYQEAGLNPNLIYGNGSASSGNAEGVKAASGGQFSYQKTFEGVQLQQGIQQALGMYWDNKMKEKQLSQYDELIRERKMKNKIQETYMSSLEIYVNDKLGATTEGYSSEQAAQLRQTPWYKQFVKEGISVEQAEQMLFNTRKQGDLLDFQDWSNDAQKGLLSGDWSSMSIGELLRGILLTLFGNRGIVK